MKHQILKIAKTLIKLSVFFGVETQEKAKRLFYYLNKLSFNKLHLDYPLLEEDLVGYLKINNKKFIFEVINAEGRPGFITDLNEKIIFSLKEPLKSTDQVWLSFAIREPLNTDHYACSVKIKTNLKNTVGEILYSGNFDVQIDGTNFLYTHRYGENWISWYIDTKNISSLILNNTSSLSVEISLPTDVKSLPKNALFLGLPQIVKTKPRAKKIICISCESLTDPALITKMFPEKANLIDPLVFEFLEKYNNASLAYSQGDSTMPSGHAQLTGLLALQHGIGSYNPSKNTSNFPVRNESIISTPQIFKRNGYLTFGSLMYSGFGPQYGSARGFDSYINVESMGSDLWPDLMNSVLPTLELSLNSDSYHHAHIDSLLHVPYMNARSTLFSGMNELSDLSEKDNRVNIYIKNLNRLFFQLNYFDTWIERHSNKADFFVQITGDHGHGLQPWWGSHNDYALYEQRVRVPYLARDFSGILPKFDRNTPVNCGVEFYKKSLLFAGISLPMNIKSLPQFSKDFEGYAISETIFHPNDDDYTLVISNLEFKFALCLKLDYDARLVKTVCWEKLFIIKNGIPDEENDVLSKHPSIASELRAKANLIVKEGLAFNKNFPTKSSLNPANNWTVNDIRSPSAKNRRIRPIVKT